MNTMNTVETQEEKNNQLRLFMETNKPVCAVHPACTLEWVDATHSFHLGCPWFPECKYKVAVARYDSPCHGCYESPEHDICSGQICSMLNYFPYCNACSDDLIIQVMAKWNRDFQIRFSKTEKRRVPDMHKCFACDKIVTEGMHVVEFFFFEGDRFFHLSQECAGFGATDLNPCGELLDLVTRFQKYVAGRDSRKRSAETSGLQTKQTTSEIVFMKKSRLQK